MNKPIDQFKAEMEKAGLFRKIKVVTNLNPPPIEIPVEVVQAVNKELAKEAITMYAAHNSDFAELLAEAAIDHLLDDVLTDDLFAPDAGFVPTAEEQAKNERAKAMAHAPF